MYNWKSLLINSEIFEQEELKLIKRTNELRKIKLYGLIDNNSKKILIQPIFEYVGKPDIDNNRIVRLGKKYGVIKPNGEYKVYPQNKTLEEAYKDEDQNKLNLEDEEIIEIMPSNKYKRLSLEPFTKRTKSIISKQMKTRPQIKKKLNIKIKINSTKVKVKKKVETIKTEKSKKKNKKTQNAIQITYQGVGLDGKLKYEGPDGYIYRRKPKKKWEKMLG